MKINVDGGLSRSGRVGVAVVVCKADHGLYLGSPTLVIPGVTEPSILEALACREGIALAWTSIFRACM